MVSGDKENGDIIFSGFENGIGVSPHKGIGNLQNINLNTLTGEALISFQRVQGTFTSNATGTGTLTFRDSSHVNLAITGSNNLFKGNWITVTSSSNTSQLPNGTYYVNPSTGAGFQLSSFYNTLTPSGSLPVTATYLLVGGGAGGGDGNAGGSGGGGGGGQVKTGTTSLNVGTSTITVGASVANNVNGNSSTAFTVTSAGGTAGSIGSGSSGGTGGAGGQSGSAKAGGTGALSVIGGGGGGGDSAVGANPVTISGGAGGAGTSNSTSGTATFYGGGGGGGGNNAGAGGTGGGGAGATGSNAGIFGSVGFGGGGGGGGPAGGTGGGGGSGTVVISFPIGSLLGVTGGAITYTDTLEVHTFISSGSLVIPTQPTSNPLTGFTTGLTATIQLVAVMGKPLASATETYFANGVVYNRYYILDNHNLVWVYDTQNEVTYSLSDNVTWFLPDYQTGWCTGASGIGIISGFLVAAAATGLYGKSVALLGNTNSQATTWTQFDGVEAWQGIAQDTGIAHFCYVGHQGNLYVTDGAYVANIFPDVTLADPASTADNIQSSGSWTASGTTVTLSIISGVVPVASDVRKVPAVFFCENGGTLPTSITAGTVYYIEVTIPSNYATFNVYSASTGGSALDMEAGAYGIQYFNTFYPLANASGYLGDTPTLVFTNQRLTLPNFEIAQCIAEIGNTLVIGCKSNTLYPWDQQTNLPSSIISLPESNTVNIITVHQMAYVFTGDKGNIYITDGSVASLVTTVPDYCAGVPGSPETYIEPYFVWQSAMYLRGRVYFSILDQTSTKVGNTGGVWSFIPTQNFYVGQDVGLALRLENQNSYGTYNGAASILIPKLNQQAISPQYFSGWFSDVTTPTYGIDSTGTFPNQTAILETELIPTGTILGQQKKTFTSEEYKLSSPLLSGESVQLNYRLTLTDAWATCGTVQTDSSNMSGYFTVNFQNSQWVQFQAIMTPNGTTTFSANRLTELRLHPSKGDFN